MTALIAKLTSELSVFDASNRTFYANISELIAKLNAEMNKAKRLELLLKKYEEEIKVTRGAKIELRRQKYFDQRDHRAAEVGFSCLAKVNRGKRLLSTLIAN